MCAVRPHDRPRTRNNQHRPFYSSNSRRRLLRQTANSQRLQHKPPRLLGHVHITPTVARQMRREGGVLGCKHAVICGSGPPYFAREAPSDNHDDWSKFLWPGIMRFRVLEPVMGAKLQERSRVGGVERANSGSELVTG